MQNKELETAVNVLAVNKINEINEETVQVTVKI